MGVQPARVIAPTAVNRKCTQYLTRAPEDGPGADRMQAGLAHKVAQSRIERITGEIICHYGRAVADGFGARCRVLLMRGSNYRAVKSFRQGGTNAQGIARFLLIQRHQRAKTAVGLRLYELPQGREQDR